MRVTHIIKVVAVAGAERHLLTLLEGLRARQIDARLILVVQPDRLMLEYVEMLAARHIPVKRLLIYGHSDVLLVRRLLAELRANLPDIAHTHLLHADLFGVPAARLARIPVVVSSRHNDNTFRRRFPIQQVNRALWRLTDAGVAISDAIALFSVEVEGCAPEKMQRIYYGLDTSARPLDRAPARADLLRTLRLNDDAALAGIVCRLIEQKGVQYGVEAFRRVAGEFPAAHLVIAGEGALRPALEAQVVASELVGRVHFLGWQEDIPRLMAGMDMLVAPSLWEGFGLVLLEAMAQQTPVIASAVSAIPEVVRDGETGLLVPPRDVEALAGAMRQFFADTPLRQHMGLLGRDRLETHFSADRMIDEHISLYHRLLDQKRRSPG